MKRFAPSPSQVVPGNKLLVNYTGYISHNYFSKHEQYTSIPQVFPGLAQRIPGHGSSLPYTFAWAEVYLGTARVYNRYSSRPKNTSISL